MSRRSRRRPKSKEAPGRSWFSWHASRDAVSPSPRRPAGAGRSIASTKEPPMVDKIKRIWLEGEFVDYDDAKIHVLTHTLHYGLGAFEGIRAYKRADGATYVFRLHEHMERLFDSCKLIMIEPR